MDAIERLRSLLNVGSQKALERPWAIEESIDSHIEHLELHLRKGVGAFVPRDLQEDAVRRFWTTKRLDSLKDARLVSFGVVLPVGPRRLRVIEDGERFPALLEGVDQYLPAPKQYRRCYQGLLSGYFAYDPDAKEVPKTGRENWEVLRSYLNKQSRRILDGERNPQWADSLQQHRTLLSENPCKRYGAPLLAGEHAEVDELREVLNISDGSWFMRELYLAQVKAAVDKSDADFRDLLYRVLDLLQENELIRDEGLALVLNRFARLKPPPLAVPLRDAAVNSWGNPWLQSNAMRWGRVSQEARSMVTEWLKLEFIEAFFTLLAEERTGDSRRLKFWARYVGAIEDIHFALGTDAQDNQSPDFQALRKKMTGLLVPLRDNVRSNNAFIMRMGSLIVVEFSGYSNACYGYDANKSLPFRLDKPVVLPVDVMNSLKHSDRSLWLRHQDGVRGFNTWEARFEAELAEGYNIQPKSSTSGPVVMPRPPKSPGRPNPGARPPTQPPPNRKLPPRSSRDEQIALEMASWKRTKYSNKALWQFADRYGLKIEDFTPPPRGGNLWVRTDDSDRGINEVLTNWGFEFKDAKKGWWWRGR